MFHNLPKLLTKRGTDILTVTQANVGMSLDDINKLAVKENNIPLYRPDGNGAVLVFHTESDSYILGGIRTNPGLKDTKYPAQLSAAIGGGAPDETRKLKESIIDSMIVKMYMKDSIAKNEAGHTDQLIIEDLIKIIGDDQGWSSHICIHTDHWNNKDGSLGTMCYLTAIKHIQTTDADLRIIEDALQSLSAIAKDKGLPPRAISDYHFVALQPVIQNAVATHMDNEEEKARKAFEQFGNKIAVTFNDLAMATLAKCDAFKCKEAATLQLTSRLSHSK